MEFDQPQIQPLILSHQTSHFFIEYFEKIKSNFECFIMPNLQIY